VLCGLRTGYRRLDRQFRGSAAQQEAIAVHALRTSCGDESICWPSVSGVLHWSKQADGFALRWGEREVARKPPQSRGRWLDADLRASGTAAAAMRLVKQLDWACVTRQIVFREDCRLPYKGDVRSDGDGLAIRGGTAINLSDDATLEDSLDVKEFHRLMVVSPGQVPDPPQTTETVVKDAPAPRPTTKMRRDVLDITGLDYMPRFVSEAEEKRLVEEIDRAQWSYELSRRVQHYGWKYDYKARQIDSSMRIGPLPDWATDLGRRLVDEGLLREQPDQVIVNEYCGRQGITPHTDAPSFADGIATISLLEAWEMNFRQGRDKRTLRLERGSALVMHGEARNGWKHEIPQRKTEPNPSAVKDKRLDRVRRLSLTFRKVRRKDASTRSADGIGRRRKFGSRAAGYAGKSR